MGKVIKMNRSGTVGVSLIPEMKSAGYDAGKEIYWEAATEGFILKLKPSAPISDAKPVPAQETP